MNDTGSGERRLIDLIHELADEVGGHVRRDYSGRGMYGARCYGVDVDDLTDALVMVGALGLPRPVVDGMGLGHILYWPHIRDDSKAEPALSEPASVR